MSEKQDVCANCKWWKEGVHPFNGRRGEIGECRAVLPCSGHQGMMDVTDAKWPTTENNDYCGHFEYRDDRAGRLLGTKYMSKSESEAA